MQNYKIPLDFKYFSVIFKFLAKKKIEVFFTFQFTL